jgi:hypothetical protein
LAGGHFLYYTFCLQVLGLAFNCKYTNMLACAAYGEKLRVYFLDYTDEVSNKYRNKFESMVGIYP